MADRTRKFIDHLLSREPEKLTEGQWVAFGLYLVSDSLDKLPEAFEELKPDGDVAFAIQRVADQIELTVGPSHDELDAWKSVSKSLDDIAGSIADLKEK
jgi:hypothetical protein